MFNKNAVPAFVFFALAAVAPAEEKKLEILQQNWGDADRHTFWYIDQGSKIMPMSWFLSLECGSTQKQCDATGLFSSPPNLKNYGFVIDTSGIPGTLNPHHLPIGFTSGTHNGVEYAGVTCAACHTGNIQYGGRSILVEGAPSMLNFDLFLSEMVDALLETQGNQVKFARFQKKLHDDYKVQLDVSAFNARVAKLKIRRDINTPTNPAGFGRVDAFGHIFNQVAVEHLGNPTTASHKPDAPASYPMLWDIAQHFFVQWNYSAPNLGEGETALGSLMRNIGEVLGVFGELEIKPRHLPTIPIIDVTARPYYKSSAEIANLREVEGLLASLHAPKWPFETPKQADIDTGKETYKHECKSCHEIYEGQTPYPAAPFRTEHVGTDPTLANNFLNLKAPSGKLEGVPKGILLWGSSLDPGILTFRGEQPLNELTAQLALNALPSVLEQAEALKLGIAEVAVVGKGPYYKARPLDGIWASPPYLHNGSVPSLAELLKPADQRVKSFCVGDWQYDPDPVGYKSYDGAACPPGTAKVDTTVPGSSNAGHPYGVNLSVEEKRCLVQFLKTL
jgi:hypothetical protein